MKRLNFGNNVTRGRACEGQRFIYGAKGILAHVFRKFGACTGNGDCGGQRHWPMRPWIIKQFFSWGGWIDVKWCNVWHVLFWRLCLHQLHRCDGHGAVSIQVPWLSQLGHPWVYTRSRSVLLRKAPGLVEHHPVLPQQQHLGHAQVILRYLKQTQPCALSLSMHIAVTTYWA